MEARASGNDSRGGSSAKTCLVLTEKGLWLAVRALLPQLEPPTGCASETDGSGRETGTAERPEWDGGRRELRVGGVMVKQFRQPAPSQETVLAAFQEEQWAPVIDDPLPGRFDQDPKLRLHDTVNNLNRHQRCQLIQFYRNGTGTGIGWRFVAPPDSGAAPVHAVVWTASKG
jgi:hypothetical protein